jgi:hypothetical protein
VPYSVTHDPSLGIVEVTFTGLLSGADLKKATRACISIQKQTRATGFLVDTGTADLGASTLDIHDLPGKQYGDEDLDIHTRIAVILPTSARTREAALFYEAACRNRGWHAKLLPDRQSAIDWLKGLSR